MLQSSQIPRARATGLTGTPAIVARAAGAGAKALTVSTIFAAAPAPIDLEILFPYGMRDRRLALLRHVRDVAAARKVDRVRERLRSKMCQAFVQFAVTFPDRDRRAFLKDDIAGVHSCVHEHDRYAGLLAPVAQCALNRGCPAILGKQAGMHVERTESWEDSSTSCGRIRPYEASTKRSYAHCFCSRANSRSESGSNTGTPSSSAACFTGVARILWPRPAGRSGCVTTAARFVRAATMCKLGTAKSLVPKKSVFTPG